MKPKLSTSNSVGFPCYIDQRLHDAAKGLCGHRNWIVKTVMKNNGWKRMSEKRWKQLFMGAYWLGRNGQKPTEKVPTLMELCPKVKNIGIKADFK